MSASETTLKQLHALLAQDFLSLIENGVPIFNKDGEEVGTRKPTAAEYAVMVAFLKANEITANLDDSDATKALKEALEARRKRAKPVLPDHLAGVH